MFANYSGLEWQPRAAIVYTLRSRTVFRAAIGIFDQPPAYGDFFAFVGNPPLYSTFNEGLFFGPTGGVGIAPGVPNPNSWSEKKAFIECTVRGRIPYKGEKVPVRRWRVEDPDSCTEDGS